jgi:hypothetical protein
MQGDIKVFSETFFLRVVVKTNNQSIFTNTFRFITHNNITLKTFSIYDERKNC